MWEWCGGESVLPYSMRWIRPLRPAQFALSALAERKAATAARLRRDGRADLDPVVARCMPAAFQVPRPQGVREGLDERMFLACLRDRAAERSFVPRIRRPFRGMGVRACPLHVLGRPSHKFAVRKAVADGNASICGWCWYCLGRNQVAEVLQIGARRGAMSEVLDHLLHDAMANGASAVSGRLEPHLVPALTEKRALFCRSPIGRCFTRGTPSCGMPCTAAMRS